MIKSKSIVKRKIKFIKLCIKILFLYYKRVNKMVNFNNKQIKIYDLDSIKSIIKRLAKKENTIPKFIYFPNGEPLIENLSEDTNIEYENILTYIKEKNTFNELYEKLKNKLSLENIVRYFIIFNEQYDTMQEEEAKDINMKGMYSGAALLSLSEEIIKIDKKYKTGDLNTIWINRFGNKENIEKEIQNNKLQSEKQETIFKNFDEIIGLEYTTFELQKVKFQIGFDSENKSLLEIFNNIKLNKYIPFATTHFFYKILKDFTPFTEWKNLFDKSKTFFDKYKNIDRNKNIIFKVLEKTDSYNDPIEDFTEVILNNDNNNTNIKIEHNIKKFFLKKEDLTNRILSILDVDDIKYEKDIEVNGVFYYPGQDVNKYVFSDLVMNDPLFSSVLTIDETKITLKTNIFVYFNNPKVGNLTAYITKQTVKKNPPINNKKEFDLLLPKNSNTYIRVKISKCENIEKVNAFQTILSKLFVLYNQKYDEIIKFYRNIGIDLVVEDQDNIDTDIYDENKLRNVDPDVFHANYTRKCIHPPTYIEDEDYQKNIDEGKKIMKFPKEKINDSFPKYYVCNYPDYKYPGLRNNPFDNSKIFPYIPCCYKKDQEKIPNSRYRNYYFNEQLKTKDQKQQDIYVSKIIIPNDFFGILPNNINKIFSITDINGIYYRKGVLRTTNSFINCVLESLNINDFHKTKKKESKTKNLLEEIRTGFATEEFAIYCKQEMYDYTIEEIINKIKNIKEYFDPKLFIRILEIKYKCNIFIFTRDNKGQLILPRHIKGYYKIKNKNKCIFIYEHMGSDSDKAEYPQCELIVRKEIEESETIDNFEFNSEISKNIFNTFEEVNNCYILNKKIDIININLKKSNIYVPISQAFDTYGKVRIINFVYDKEKYISILTTPIQPLDFKEKDLSIIYKTDINTVLDFAKELNITITKQVIDQNENVIEIYGIIGNINISIPIEFGHLKVETIDYIIISNNIEFNIQESLINLSYIENTISTIEQYNKYKKLSRYISQYVLWLYSKYLKKFNIQDYEQVISYENMNNFKLEYINIKEDHVYEEVPKTFDMNNSLISNNKLIIKSEETLKRLFYILKLSIIRNTNEIINYYDRKVIDNYYLDISDFDKYNFQVILEGEDSVDKWIDEYNKIKNILYKDIQFQKRNPYFFKNQLIDNNIYIAQNTDSIKKALNISLIWNKYKYNAGYDYEEEELNYEFILYSFTNFKNIKMYNIDGEENNYNIKIIGYNVNNKSMYTVLLNI